VLLLCTKILSAELKYEGRGLRYRPPRGVGGWGAQSAERVQAGGGGMVNGGGFGGVAVAVVVGGWVVFLIRSYAPGLHVAATPPASRGLHLGPVASCMRAVSAVAGRSRAAPGGAGVKGHCGTACCMMRKTHKWRRAPDCTLRKTWPLACVVCWDLHLNCRPMTHVPTCRR
jgi:hypothetical protein